jgi:hypothetical protein
MEKAYLTAFLQKPQGMLKSTRGALQMVFSADRHEHFLVSHGSFSLCMALGISPCRVQPALRACSSSGMASPVVMMLFQNLIADAWQSDQRGAASPQAQESLCRSFTRPSGLCVSGIGIRPQAQSWISSRDMLMAGRYRMLRGSSIPCADQCGFHREKIPALRALLP